MDIFTPEQKRLETEDDDQYVHNDDQKKQEENEGYIWYLPLSGRGLGQKTMTIGRLQ